MAQENGRNKPNIDLLEKVIQEAIKRKEMPVSLRIYEEHLKEIKSHQQLKKSQKSQVTTQYFLP